MNKINQYEKYLVTDKEINGQKCDADRCKYVWDNLYIPFYSNMDFWKSTKFPCKNNSMCYNGYNCEISGDVAFNFKRYIGNKNGQKYEYFEELITRDYSGKEREKHLEDLDYCNLMFHSLHNFVLMPVTGAMNNFKGSGTEMIDNNHNLDRPDKFLYFLKQYYKKRNIDSPIFSRASGRNSKEHTAEENTVILKRKLKKFLDYVGDVYKYCEYFYLIKGKEYIDCLIDSGNKPIVSGRDVVAYMELAEEFWEIRHETIKNSKLQLI